MAVEKYIKFVSLFIALSFVSCELRLKQQEQSFMQELNQMLAWPDNGTYSDAIMDNVFELIKKNPQSLDYDFGGETSHMRIATSDDGNVRAYSLERCGFAGNPSSGGFDCKIMLQYKAGEMVFCNEVENFYGYITHIHNIDSNTFYLLEDFQVSIQQGLYESYNFYVYKIENNKLHKVKEAFVNKEDVADKLEFSWNDCGGYLLSNPENEGAAFIYNKFNKELYVAKGMPLAGQPLKYRQYNWNEQHFELKKYDEPIEFKNSKYFIRIEQQCENFWTYKCWNGSEKQGEPDLIIKSGSKQYWLEDGPLISYDEWGTDDESSPLGEKYTFFNNGYRYEYYHGWSKGRMFEDLYVYDSNETMIYSGYFIPVE